MTQKRILVAAGGTGGHIYPALAVWEEIKSRHPDTDLSWIGSSHRMEADLIPSMGIDFHGIRQTEIRRGASAGNLFYNMRSMWYLNKAIGEAKKLINELNPAVIISTGGFAAGATGLAAGMTRTPLVIIEPNAYPGLTNKKLGPAAEMIFISYDSAREFFPVDKTFNYGVPTRKALFEIDRNEARQKLGIAEDTVMVLATGGSQGADSININLPFGILQMVRDFEDIDIKVFHQAGKGRIDEARIFREEMDDDMYEVVEFIEDMPTHLAAADIVVSRAGASTLAEISAVGVASIIFPFPKAAENHQYKNAKEWEDAGATILLTDGSTNIGDMTASLSRLFYDRSVRDEMAAASRKFSHPDSAKNIADKLDKFLG